MPTAEQGFIFEVTVNDRVWVILTSHTKTKQTHLIPFLTWKRVFGSNTAEWDGKRISVATQPTGGDEMKFVDVSGIYPEEVSFSCEFECKVKAPEVTTRIHLCREGLLETFGYIPECFYLRVIQPEN